jgi:murein DD-endopeptidase MepM/ murein hydrolase activator NlpD
MMVNVFIKLLNISFSASLLILACIIIRFAFKKMPKYLRCVLWLLVLVRLVCPLHLESPFSVLPKKDLISREVVVSDTSDDSNSLEERIHIGQSEYVTDTYEGGSIYYLQNDNSANYPETSDTQSQQKQNIKDNSKDNVIQSNTSNYMKYVNRTSIFKLLSVIWFLGVLVSLGYGVVAYIRLKKCVSTAVRLKDNIYQTENIASPFVLGVFNVRIYIPYNLSPTEIFFVLSHERSHIARKDYLLKPFAYAVACVYWFNPLVWLGYVLLCRDIELACDEKAINLIGYNRKKAYSQSILDFSVPKKYISACPVAFGETGVKERVKSVLSMKKHKKIAVVAGVVIIAVTGVGFLTYPKVNAEKSGAEDVKTTEALTEYDEKNSSNIVSETDEETTEEKIVENAKETATVGNAEDNEFKFSIEKIGSNEWGLREDADVLVMDAGGALINDEGKDGITDQIQNAINNYMSENKDYSQCIIKNYRFNTDEATHDPNENPRLIIQCHLLDILGGESYTITRLFSEDHQGIDYALEEGSAVYNARTGTVSDVGYDDNRGNYIEVKSEDGKTFIYNHLKDTAIPVVGKKIEWGMKIGEVGSTGKSTGPHLHFAVKEANGEYINPEKFFITEQKLNVTYETADGQELWEPGDIFDIVYDDDVLTFDASGKSFKDIKEFIDTLENTFKSDNEFLDDKESIQAAKAYKVKNFEIEEPFNGKTLSGELYGWYNYGTETILGTSDEQDSSKLIVSKGYLENHKGLDIAVDEDASIYTTFSGQVESIGYYEELGNYIKIKTYSGVSITYYQLKSLENFEIGDEVIHGTKIGEGGTISEDNAEPHIHMTVLGPDDEYLNPKYFLTNHSIEIHNEELGDQVWLVNTDSGVVVVNQ